MRTSTLAATCPPRRLKRPPGAPRPWSLSPPCPTASALAGSPEILILDDSSSALDYKTDAALRKALREEYQGITTIIIAQRVSSILHADHILVLEEGKELGYGTPQELLRSCPVYQDIAHSQMGYSQDGALEARGKEVV